MGCYGMNDDLARYFESQCDRLGLDQAGASWLHNTYYKVWNRIEELDRMGYGEISVHASPMATNCSNPTYMSVTYPDGWSGMEYLLNAVAMMCEYNGGCDNPYESIERILWDRWAAAGIKTPYVVIRWHSY